MPYNYTIFFTDSCDVANQTSVSLNLHTTAQIILEQGQIYFVTVTAVNAAGLSTTSSSDGFLVDTTPPVISGFSSTSIVAVDLNRTNDNNVTRTNNAINVNSSKITGILTNRYKVSAAWSSVFDLESDIRSIAVCASTSKDTCNLAPWTVVNPTYSSTSLDFANPLETGTIFILKLKAENGPGLETTAYTGSIIVDDTPPSKGNVKVGKSNTTVFIQEEETLIASWSNFVDAESHIKMNEWKICSASRPSECVNEFVNTGQKTNLVLEDVGIEQGIEYNLVVKVTNYAELGTLAVSNLFVLDKTPPQAGMVFDGATYLNDKAFQSASSEMSVTWKGFQDKESGIKRFEVCVGSIAGLCDIYGFKNFGVTARASIHNLNLTHNETYFTTVRAVNGAGQTSFASSNGIVVDLTSPQGGSLRDGDDADIDMTVYDSYVSANWDEFHDPESGVLKYTFCAGTVKGSCDVLPLTTVRDRLAIRMQVKPAISSGTVVYSTLGVHNNAGGLTEVHSSGVLVDSTPPDAGKVKHH